MPQGWNRPPVVLPAGNIRLSELRVWLLLELPNSFAFNKLAPAFWTTRNGFLKSPEFSSESVVDEEAAETEVQSIYTSQQNYLELIRQDTPSPPVIEYQGHCGEVETNIYDEPVKELLIIESESKESTPEYQSVPVKDLINTFEQGKSLQFLFWLPQRFRQFRRLT